MIAIIMDGGANVKMACRLLRWKIGHNLDLSISMGLQDSYIKELLKVCRQVVSKFSYSWKKTRDLASFQADNNLTSCKLKIKCTTKWGSTFDMLNRISKQQKAICVLLSSDRKCINPLLSLNFDVVDSVISVLKPLHELTDLLAAE